jgi:hypothetical protein
MFERAFTMHTTSDGLKFGLGAVWQFDKRHQVYLIETATEPIFLP